MTYANSLLHAPLLHTLPLLRALPLLLCLSLAGPASAQAPGKYEAIHSGVPLFDDRGKEVSAHGGAIVKDGDRYYLFGEAHVDGSNAFAGFNAYSSADLYHWKYEGVALPVQKDGALGPERVGERPKVMKSPQTGEYVMYMHADAMDYRDQYVGYATAPTVTGPYTFRGPLLFNGQPVKKWDMGAFQDDDGAGYILLHGGDIYRLADDYKSLVSHVNQAMAHGFESPAMFRHRDTYYFLGSNLTGWERNDNYYYTAKQLSGPWHKRGLIAPEGTLTWNSQVTFVLPIRGSAGTSFMYMGDRWSFPRQATAATYVWQPLNIQDGTLLLPHYHDDWSIDVATGLVGIKAGDDMAMAPIDDSDTGARSGHAVSYSGNWQREAAPVSHHRTADKDAAVTIRFEGRQASLYAVAGIDGGYARITVKNSRGATVVNAIVDMYSQYTTPARKFITPMLARDRYTLRMTALGENWYWINKRKERSGSKGYMVSFNKLTVQQ